MGPLQLVVSSVGSLVIYGLVIAAVYKLFQIGADLTEIKDTLGDIKRAAEAGSPLGWTPRGAKETSPESLMRALDSTSYPEALSTDPTDVAPHS